MLLKWLVKQMHSNQGQQETITSVLNVFQKSTDFNAYEHYNSPVPYKLMFFSSLVDPDRLHKDVLPYVNKYITEGIEVLKEKIPIEEVTITSDTREIKNKVLQGNILLQLVADKEECLLIEASVNFERDVGMPEIEFTVTGPQESFIESLDTNINLIRKRLPLPNLQIKEIEVGKITKSKVVVLFIEGIADQENVKTMVQRIEDIEFDQILDSSMLNQMVSDSSFSIFPVYVNTERPDRVSAALTEGKVVVLSSGSPEAFFGPTTLIEFFSSLEDYYLPWHIASFVRILRFFAVSFSVLAAPIYIAVLTFHYELIPKDLLATIISSRSNIPFPPIIEALFLEFTIELLREAGARLPTKVGQTIGIVGGIVIGQASVEAGLTSNILLIIVALSALASFTTPVYQMGNTIRIIRFPIMIAAAILGGIGIVICLLFTIAHLVRLTSLGRPYLEPVYPLRIKDWKDAFFRLPFTFFSSRPVLMRPRDTKRFNPSRVKKTKDIDE
ncbi:spore germination protein [Alkalihalobacterium alkalinitrilicum]|uniref:spore germination protein n=1 Tax=Alkalihalobacterium alkalinitrilicum TaxID=427920 RepID=UPI000995471B|nr:spore germination protein [Alkalihalobacterium alkalinitrilicum]